MLIAYKNNQKDVISITYCSETKIYKASNNYWYLSAVRSLAYYSINNYNSDWKKNSSLLFRTGMRGQTWWIDMNNVMLIRDVLRMLLSLWALWRQTATNNKKKTGMEKYLIGSTGYLMKCWIKASTDENVSPCLTLMMAYETGKVRFWETFFTG